MAEKYWVGIDLGGTCVRVGLLNDDGIILNEMKGYTEVHKGPAYIIEKIKDMVVKTKMHYTIEGIGIGMPGPLNPYTGVVLSPVNLPEWHSIKLASIIGDFFEVPCFIENDGNVAALAEALKGAGKGYPIVFYITVSTGIGGGLCIDGKIISGATGNAGEIANIIVSDDKIKHSFLNPGALEGMASGLNIVRMAKDKGLKVDKAHEVFILADEGNIIATEIANITIESLAKGMAAIAHVVDPHTFVLGGGVALSAPKLIDKIKDKFDTYIYEVMRGKIRIEPARLADPGIVGAMLMAKNRLEMK